MLQSPHVGPLGLSWRCVLALALLPSGNGAGRPSSMGPQASQIGTGSWTNPTSPQHPNREAAGEDMRMQKGLAR